MTSVAKYLPEDSETVTAIYEHWRKKGESEQRDMNTLGASAVGGPCERALWFSFRHCCRPSFPGRMHRLFDRGDMEEPRIVADLQAIGCTVHEADESTGKQFRVEALGGHLSGYMDGAILGVPEAPKTWHVLEAKTHKAKSWRKLQREGVKKAEPKHYAQCMIYMHLTGMKRALYVAVNKDTEELYTERVRYDAVEAEALIERARRVIFAQEPPPRISEKSDYFICRFCDAKDVCFGTTNPVLSVPSLSCRQCCHATPTMDGNAHWVCEKHKKGLSLNDQCRTLCEDHLVLPCILEPTVSPSDYGTDSEGYDYITFRDDVWGEWRHGRGAGAYNSGELRKLPLEILSNDMLQAAKETFDGTVPTSPDTILGRYLDEDTRLVWTGRFNAAEIGEVWRAAYGEALDDLEPIQITDQPTYAVAEYEGERIMLVDKTTKQVTIRDKGVR